jgi:CHAT domain-containing protein
MWSPPPACGAAPATRSPSSGARPRGRARICRVGGAGIAALVALAVLSASAACAQPYARLAVPDSALVAAVRATGADFEATWNALLLAELRASSAAADSARWLAPLERRVAAAEPAALGTRIAADALALRRRWDVAQQRKRIAAAGDEAAATAAQRAGRWAESDSLFRAALDGYRAVGERRRTAWVLGSAGSTWFLAGDYVRADSLYRAALAARRAIGDSALVARAVNTLGTISYLEYRYRPALDWFLRARALRVEIGDRAGLTSTLNYLGLVAVELGWPDSARAWYGQALELAVSRGDSARTSEVLSNLAVLLERQGEAERAGALALRGAHIAEERGDTRTLARLRQVLGSARLSLGRYTEAAAWQSSTVELCAGSGDTRGLLEGLIALGQTRVLLQDAERARPALTRAAALADSLGDRNAGARARIDLALVAREAGDLDAATRTAREALGLAAAAGDSGVVREAASTLGQLAADRRDLAAAQAWFERAAAACAGLDVDAQVAASINLGYVLAMRDRRDEAEAVFRGALAAGESAGLPDRVWLAMLGLGDVAERRGAMDSALAWDRRAAALIDTLRGRQSDEGGSTALFSRRLFAYEALIHLLGRVADASGDARYSAEAFLWAERARARSLLDLMQASGQVAPRTEPLPLERAQRLLADGHGGILAYSLGDSSSSLWVITRGAWQRFRLPPRSALRGRVLQLRRALADPASADGPLARAAARDLYRTLVQPAEPLLSGVRNVVVLPDGPLALLPFEALLRRDVREGATVPVGAWLLDRYDLSYAPSATALATRERDAGTGRGRAIVALGDPRFRDPGDSLAAPVALAPLPCTAAEVGCLRSLAGTRPVTALTGAGATRAALLACPQLPGAGLVHLATHARSDEVEPQRSGLWLAAENGAPGFLDVEDVLGLRLDADLVTLSACETGVGRVVQGEGVMGLARAFLGAGARSVVVSLWKVDDRASSRLMETFYRDLLDRDMSRVRALAEAKRALLANSDTRSPAHWAAFVLWGTDGRVR